MRRRRAIVYDDRLPSPAHYRRLFETTGWNEAYRLDEEALHRGLHQSWRLVTAWDAARLVGSGRLIADGVQYALVADLIVDPAYQRRGIGSEMLRRLLAYADRSGVRDVLLFAAEGSAAFYERHGFRRRGANAPGMIRRMAWRTGPDTASQPSARLPPHRPLTP